ncbi:MAG: NYN domain-containing protein [Candidatus Omnitrophota bacterium]|jgi:predicted RNA-binding protein with PIN domain
MSLQYVIDGYNVIKHACYAAPKRVKDPKFGLLEVIKFQHLCGSLKNNVTVVFDGYPDSYNSVLTDPWICVVFSHEESADERIKKIVSSSGNPKNIVVVSDDREIKFCIRASGARPLGVDEFLNTPKKQRPAAGRQDLIKFDLSYTQVDKINKEFKEIWLGHDKEKK